jgi:GNAT superfamily N-acetyltransferase
MTDIAISPLTVRQLVPPATVDAPDAGPFLRMIEIANAACRRDAGHGDLDEDPAEALVSWHEQTDWGRTGFVAERDGEIIGVANLMYQQEAGATTAEFDLWISPERWGEGAEEALLAAVEAGARALGRTSIQIFTLHRPGAGGSMLAPSTGWGGVPAADRQTVFCLENGLTLEQVERNSAFDLTASFAGVERLLAEAQAASGAYRVVQWLAPTPPEYADGYAWMKSRMSTDAPAAAMEFDEETWDAARIAEHDAKYTDSGRTIQVTAAQHIETGQLCAFNELVIGKDHAEASHQEDTLVLREHRGHKLGTLVKCAGLLSWRDIAPASRRVITYNAEENRPMLDINEAIGFAPIAYVGAWKKVLDD